MKNRCSGVKPSMSLARPFVACRPWNWTSNSTSSCLWILGHSRRRHYGHAAMPAAACVALSPTGRQRELITWITVLQQTYSRRSAFRQELWRALEGLGVRSVPELPGRRA
jgi:hypothetical protein